MLFHRYVFKTRTVFCHFVGAVPNSTNLLAMLQRLLFETTGITDRNALPNCLEDAMNHVRSFLSNPSANSTIVIVDGINQFEDIHGAPAPVSWLPTQLSPNVRLITSATPESRQYKLIHDLAEDWKLEQIRPLDRPTKLEIINATLSKWNRYLDQAQMELLLNKRNSDNPFWLNLACEEIRTLESFREITSTIKRFPDSLAEMEEQLLSQWENECDSNLFIAMLCLLECSVRGLLEDEILQLLAALQELPIDLVRLLEEKNAACINILKSSNSMEVENMAIQSNEVVYSDKGKISMEAWLNLFRPIRQFIRPFGSSSEGLLNFYHRSLSKAVRKRYFYRTTTCSTGEKIVKVDSITSWFHGYLASYFAIKRHDIDRQIEE